MLPVFVVNPVVIVDHPEFAGSYVERARLLTAAHDFDGAVEAAQSTLGLVSWPMLLMD